MTDAPKPLDTIPPDMPQPPGAPPAQAVTPIAKFWWYCLNEEHQGSPRYGQQPLDLKRIFGTDTDEGCPTCPSCAKQTSCVPCAGPNIPPQSIVEYARHFAETQVLGGIGR